MLMDRLFTGTVVSREKQGFIMKSQASRVVANISASVLSVLAHMPKAVRAVANANGANAISIFVPCHRVIGSDRSLTGYGGGLAAKRMLLDLEADNVHGQVPYSIF